MSFIKNTSEEKNEVPPIVYAPMHPVLKLPNPTTKTAKDHLKQFKEVNPFAEAEARKKEEEEEEE